MINTKHIINNDTDITVSHYSDTLHASRALSAASSSLSSCRYCYLPYHDNDVTNVH